MGVYAAVRREAERGVGAVLRPCTASSTGSRRGADVLVTILDRRPGAVVTKAGDRERRKYEYYGFLLWCPRLPSTICKEPLLHMKIHESVQYGIALIA